VDIIDACCTGNLSELKISFHNDLFAATVVAASAGYPGDYPKGKIINGLESVKGVEDTILFHAGTTRSEEHIVTSGGRVLAITGRGNSLARALGRAYVAINHINFDGMQYRKDIGSRHLKKVKLAILGSTRGTDMQAIIDSITRKELNAEVSIVISNLKSAYILERAKNHGISNLFISAKGRTREEFDADVIQTLEKYDIDLILLIGFMRIISSLLISKFQNRILNVHPSLLPEFAGGMDLNVHEQVLKAGRTKSGCTVHFVTEIVDGGGIIVQKECPITENETPETLKQKVQHLEGLALIESIRMYQQDRIK